jgi:tRNA pseudouridine55 synthase
VSRRRPSKFNGLLPVYKQAGPTSHDVVDMARKALHERRIGHTGTLDPLAEGLLLLCVGNATRLQQFLLKWDKRYLGEVLLGHATSTYDSEGEATDPRGEPPALGQEVIARLTARFSGEIEQVPPPFSAKKIHGKKLYELARNGEEVHPEPKTVRVESITISAKSPDVLTVDTTTSTGFYVRSLAHDIGIELGCGGYLHHLHRASIGPYTTRDALSQAALENAKGPDDVVGSSSWIPIERIALPFPEVAVNATAAERFTHGQDVVVFSPGGMDVENGAHVVMRGAAGAFLGVGTVRAVLARGRTLNIAPAIVLGSAQGSRSPRESAR